MGKNSCQKFQFLTLKKKKNPFPKEEKTEKNFVKLTYFPRLTNFISCYVEKRKFCITPQIFRQNELNVKVEFTEFLTFYWNHVVSTYSRKFPSSSQVISRFLSLFSRMLDEFHEFFSSLFPRLFAKMKFPKLSVLFTYAYAFLNACARISQLNIQNKNNNKTVS